MKLEFYRPKNDTLKKYIEGYYFISPGGSAAPFHYWTFPNNFFIVSVSLNIEIEMEQNRFTIKQSKKENTIANFVARYKAPIEVIYKDSIHELTVYFKPLGISHFVNNTIALLQQDAAYFDPYTDFKAVMNKILQLNDRELQVETLERYWLSKLEIKDVALLTKIITGIESDLRIDEIARTNNITRQHLNNLFKKNTGKSPAEYRKIHRFRTTLMKKKNTKNLTDLTYSSLFYDQSHMIKDFKELTKVTPHSFFKKVDTAKENVWLFI
ncbi:MAG: helix-turn-helix domain-containing protein [Ferruginibacter sp.]